MIALFQVVVPLLLITVLAVTRQPSRWRWAATTVSFGVVILLMWATARWELASVYLRLIYPVLYVAAAFVGFRRIRRPDPPPGKLATTVAYAINAALVVFVGGILWFTLPGYAVPEGAVDLANPLPEGRFVVLHGGNSPFINGHYHVRPQTYALDIVGLNALGGRARLFGNSARLEDYEVYGAMLRSPCDGTVALAVDEFEDLIPPNVDTENLAGNHILIQCRGVEVLLGHLQFGSIRVAAGETVMTGTVLGRVGNTGNTSEPHLHIHAERGGEPGVILNGEAVPITIEGRYLTRGSTFGI